jgi:hypothetical protein
LIEAEAVLEERPGTTVPVVAVRVSRSLFWTVTPTLADGSSAERPCGSFSWLALHVARAAAYWVSATCAWR